MVRNVEGELSETDKHENISITKEYIAEVTKVPNKKAPGLDRVHGFWLKKLPVPIKCWRMS